MSGKKERERRREERLQAESQGDERERRQRLLRVGGIVAGLAVLAIGVIVLVGQSQDSGGDTDLSGVEEVLAQLDGVEQQGTVLGDRTASVSIVEFADLQCPVCKQFSEDTTPGLIEGPVAARRASMELRQWPILGEDSEVAAKAALAAAEQGVYWQFVEIFFKNQGIEGSGYVTDEFLEAVAEAAGVADLGGWDAARRSPQVARRVAANDAAAQRLGLTGTPSLIVTGPGGQRQLGAASVEEVEAAMDEVSR